MTLAQVYDPTKNIIASTKIQLVDFSDEAKYQVEQKLLAKGVKGVRFGLTGGGCAGFEYIFDSVKEKSPEDIVVDFGKLQFVIDKISVPYINGMTLDWRKEGLNEVFKFINPKEQSSCGCGVSINFDLEQVEVDKSKIFAIEV